MALPTIWSSCSPLRTTGRGTRHGQIWKYVKWGYFDDFHTDSTGAYEIFDSLNTGGTFTYDAEDKGQRSSRETNRVEIPEDIYGDSKMIHNSGCFP